MVILTENSGAAASMAACFSKYSYQTVAGEERTLTRQSSASPGPDEIVRIACHTCTDPILKPTQSNASYAKASEHATNVGIVFQS